MYIHVQNFMFILSTTSSSGGMIFYLNFLWDLNLQPVVSECIVGENVAHNSST